MWLCLHHFIFGVFFSIPVTITIAKHTSFLSAAVFPPPADKITLGIGTSQDGEDRNTWPTVILISHLVFIALGSFWFSVLFISGHQLKSCGLSIGSPSIVQHILLHFSDVT